MDSCMNSGREIVDSRPKIRLRLMKGVSSSTMAARGRLPGFHTRGTLRRVKRRTWRMRHLKPWAEQSSMYTTAHRSVTVQVTASRVTSRIDTSVSGCSRNAPRLSRVR